MLNKTLLQILVLLSIAKLVHCSEGASKYEVVLSGSCDKWITTKDECVEAIIDLGLIEADFDGKPKNTNNPEGKAVEFDIYAASYRPRGCGIWFNNGSKDDIRWNADNTSTTCGDDSFSCICKVSSAPKYTVLDSGSCDNWITTKDECVAAIIELGLIEADFDGKPKNTRNPEGKPVEFDIYAAYYRPKGCGIWFDNGSKDDIRWNADTTTTTCGADSFSCICKTDSAQTKVLKNIYPNHCVSWKEDCVKNLVANAPVTEDECKDKALADSACWQEDGMVQIWFYDDSAIETHKDQYCYCSTKRNPWLTHDTFNFGAWYNPPHTCHRMFMYGNSCETHSDCESMTASGEYKCSNGVCSPCEVCDPVPEDCENIIEAEGKCGCAYCGDDTPRKIGKDWWPVGAWNPVNGRSTPVSIDECYEKVQEDPKCEAEADGRYVFLTQSPVPNVHFCICNTNKASDFGTSKPFRWVNQWIRGDIYSARPAIAAPEVEYEVLESGSCDEWITTKDECVEAIIELGLIEADFDGKPKNTRNPEGKPVEFDIYAAYYRPRGCGIWFDNGSKDDIRWNADTTTTTCGADSFSCICKNSGSATERRNLKFDEYSNEGRRRQALESEVEEARRRRLLDQFF